MKVVIAEANERDPLLAFQLQKREQRRLVVSNAHMQQLAAINAWARFLPQPNASETTVCDGREDVDTIEDILRSTETRELESEAAEINAEMVKVGYSDSLAILSLND